MNELKIIKIMDNLFNDSINDIYSFYKKISLEIEKEALLKINKKIKERITTSQEYSTNRLLIIGAFLNKTGSSFEEIMAFFCKYINQRISLNQFNFVIFALYNNLYPVSSDILFDLTEYTYLDNKIIERRIKELTEKIKPFTNIKTILFLFLLFLRNDLRNENLKLILAVLLNISSSLKHKLKENKLIKDFLIIRKPNIPQKEQKRIIKTVPQEKPKKVSKNILEIKKEKTVDTEANKEITETIQKEISDLKKSVPKHIHIFIVIFIIAVIALVSIFFIYKKEQVINTKEQKVEDIRKEKQRPLTETSEQKKDIDIQKGETLIEYYTIKKGDTLSDISKKFYGKGYLYQELADINKIKNPDLIYPGDSLKIPIDTKKSKNKD